MHDHTKLRETQSVLNDLIHALPEDFFLRFLVFSFPPSISSLQSPAFSLPPKHLKDIS